MSLDLLDALLGEHAVFYAQFDRVESTASATRDLATLQEQAAMIAAALVSHAKLEEELLFAALDRVPDAAGPLVVMRDEHAHIEDALARAEKASFAESAKEQLHEAVASARDHFRKEEIILFPLARRVFGPAELARAADVWAARRRVALAE